MVTQVNYITFLLMDPPTIPDGMDAYLKMRITPSYLQVIRGPVVLVVGQRRELQVQRLQVLRVQRHARRQPRRVAPEREACRFY